MRRKKDIVVDEEEKFRIPMIDFCDSSFVRKKERFVRSEAVSPFHGTNVLDRQAIVDNSGFTDVDFTYDFIRDKKHISKEDLIKKYGTEYYEFQMVKRDSELYEGSDYTKKPQAPKAVVEEKTHSNGFNFFSTVDEVENSIEEVNTPIIEEEKEIDVFDENQEFSLNIEIDDNDSYSYNTFDKKFDTPQPQDVSRFINKKPVLKPKEEYSLSEDLSFDSIPDLNAPEISFSDEEIIEEEIEVTPLQPKVEVKKERKPEPVAVELKNNYEDYFIPVNEFFPKSEEVKKETPQWVLEKRDVIDTVLKSFGIDGRVVGFTRGPAFTRFEVLLAPGVNVKRVPQISSDLQAALQVLSLRIQAPIPGKGTVGIETPNEVVDMVKYGDILTEKFLTTPKNLTVALGLDIDGNPVYQNIDDMPHALVAGATKSGKSVCLNTILISLLIKNAPDNLKLILVDPKRVELSFYNDLPHLATPVITDPLVATEALKWCVNEMERRFDAFARARVKNIGDYNVKREKNPSLEKIPYIVIVIDEFNDLVMTSGQEVQDYIVRIAQKARACGIHVILATQRPTVKVVNGTIKANIPCRIAFRVASQVDSSTILDEVGAESLLGRGDMLIKNEGIPIRAQGAYIADEEIELVCDYLVDKYTPDFLFTHEDLKRSMKGSSSIASNDAPQESDEMLYQVACYCIETNNCSVNSIQSNFGLGFNRASRIVKMLEDRKIVSTKNSTKPREILVDSYQLREIFHIDD